MGQGFAIAGVLALVLSPADAATPWQPIGLGGTAG
jgi:hypothetical protein